MRFAYPCQLMPDEPPGSFSATFPDVPEAITCGSSLGEALENAQEALELVLADHLDEQSSRGTIPEPSPLRDGQELVALPLAFAAKMALLITMNQERISPETLGDQLDLNNQEVQDLTNPFLTSPLSTLTRALYATGQRLVVEQIPQEPGEHPNTPAGPRAMDDDEFIRRVRQYCLHQGLDWRIEHQHHEDASVNIQVAGNSAPLPEGRFSPEMLASLQEALQIDPREF